MKKYLLSMLATTVLSMAQEPLLESNTTAAPVAVEPESFYLVETHEGPQFHAKYNIYLGVLGIQNGELEYKIAPKLALSGYIGVGAQSTTSTYALFSAGARAYYYTSGVFETGNYVSVRTSYDMVSTTSGTQALSGGGLTYGFVGGYIYNSKLFTASFEFGYGMGNYALTNNTTNAKEERYAGGFLLGANVGFPF